MVRDAYRDFPPGGEPVRTGRVVVEAEGHRQRPGPPARGEGLGDGGDLHPELAHVVDAGSQHGKVEPLGSLLEPVHGPDRSVGRGQCRQAVDGIGRYHDDPGPDQSGGGHVHHLGRIHPLGRIRGPGGDDPHAEAQRESGRMGAAKSDGSDFQSTSGTST